MLSSDFSSEWEGSRKSQWIQEPIWYSLKRMTEESNGLLQIEEVVVHPVSSQIRSYCKRAVQILKKVALMMLRKRKNEKLPISMLEEAFIIMESAC